MWMGMRLKSIECYRNRDRTQTESSRELIRVCMNADADAQSHIRVLIRSDAQTNKNANRVDRVLKGARFHLLSEREKTHLHRYFTPNADTYDPDICFCFTVNSIMNTNLRLFSPFTHASFPEWHVNEMLKPGNENKHPHT